MLRLVKNPMNKRKVFEVLECGGPGGTGNQVAAICNGLDPALFEVGLVFASRGTDPEKFRQTAHGAVRAFYMPELVREINPSADLKALLRLRRLFETEKPDVVHLHSSKAGFLGRLAARLAGVQSIYYSPHGYGFLQQDRSAASRTLYKCLERLVSGIGEIVAVSPSEATLAQELSGRRPVHTVCDGVIGNFDGPLTPHDGTIVGGCGRLAAARDPGAFVNLCQRLTDSRNGLHCVWIGGGEEEASVKRHLENMNLLSKVEVTGWLEPDAAAARLRQLDIFVHYSRWDGLPNAVLEAMAMGLPVVASDIPANRDAIVPGETGFLARSEKDLLEHCLKLIDDPDLRKKMGEAGRRRAAQEFSHAASLKRLAQLYRGEPA
jgi:glycosyltransferase involved in cell wall biosynthesis